jgi:hypothetical protein
VESVRGEGLVGAAFVHRLSCAGDPQLHTHILVANMVRDGSGRWTALDGRRLYAHGRTAWLPLERGQLAHPQERLQDRPRQAEDLQQCADIGD